MTWRSKILIKNDIGQRKKWRVTQHKLFALINLHKRQDHLGWSKCLSLPNMTPGGKLSLPHKQHGLVGLLSHWEEPRNIENNQKQHREQAWNDWGQMSLTLSAVLWYWYCGSFGEMWFVIQDS